MPGQPPTYSDVLKEENGKSGGGVANRSVHQQPQSQAHHSQYHNGHQHVSPGPETNQTQQYHPVGYVPQWNPMLQHPQQHQQQHPQQLHLQQAHAFGQGQLQLPYAGAPVYPGMMPSPYGMLPFNGAAIGNGSFGNATLSNSGSTHAPGGGADPLHAPGQPMPIPVQMLNQQYIQMLQQQIQMLQAQIGQQPQTQSSASMAGSQQHPNHPQAFSTQMMPGMAYPGYPGAAAQAFPSAIPQGQGAMYYQQANAGHAMASSQQHSHQQSSPYSSGSEGGVSLPPDFRPSQAPPYSRFTPGLYSTGKVKPGDLPPAMQERVRQEQEERLKKLALQESQKQSHLQQQQQQQQQIPMQLHHPYDSGSSRTSVHSAASQQSKEEQHRNELRLQLEQHEEEDRRQVVSPRRKSSASGKNGVELGNSQQVVSPREHEQNEENDRRQRPVVSPRKPLSPRPPPAAPRKVLPGTLREEIHKFQLEDYARQFFQHHKRGHIFRRKISFADMLKWSKDPIPTALLGNLSERHQKEAVEIFKCIQVFMKERTGNTKKTRVAQTVLAKGLSIPELRDETYCQLCKQLTDNPNIECTLRGWELLAVTLEAFPPTKDLEPYIRWFLYSASRQEITSETHRKIPLFAAHCLRRYDAVWRAKGIVRMPTVAEIKQAKVAPFSSSIFGGDLHHMMEEQRRHCPGLLVPSVLIVICSNILESGGHLTEGIFRISANNTEMYEIKIRLENGLQVLQPNKSPHTPAALLKTWIGELLSSLVPADCYDSLLAAKDDPETIVGIIQRKLPEDNRNTLYFLVHFLRIIAAHKSVNLMGEKNLSLIFSPNIFRCPYDEPRVQLYNTKLESLVLERILHHLPIPPALQILSVRDESSQPDAAN